MRHMKRSSALDLSLTMARRVEPWLENVGETGCLEPAFKQSTNDDDHNRVINYREHLRTRVFIFNTCTNIFASYLYQLIRSKPKSRHK